MNATAHRMLIVHTPLLALNEQYISGPGFGEVSQFTFKLPQRVSVTIEGKSYGTVMYESVSIKNSGREVIRESDVIEPLCATLPEGCEILDVFPTKDASKWNPIIDGNKITFPVLTMNSGETQSFNVVCTYLGEIGDLKWSWSGKIANINHLDVKGEHFFDNAIATAEDNDLLFFYHLKAPVGGLPVLCVWMIGWEIVAYLGIFALCYLVTLTLIRRSIATDFSRMRRRMILMGVTLSTMAFAEVVFSVIFREVVATTSGIWVVMFVWSLVLIVHILLVVFIRKKRLPLSEET